MQKMMAAPELWFDVGLKRYTTGLRTNQGRCQLWFDVGLKRYTTCGFRRLK